MKRRAVYLSGPMTGWFEYNKRWFMNEAEIWTALGVKVFNPHTFFGEDLIKILHKYTRLAWYLAMARDLLIMWYASVRYDLVVYVHPCWMLSKGARIEVALAHKLDVEVI